MPRPGIMSRTTGTGHWGPRMRTTTILVCLGLTAVTPRAATAQSSATYRAQVTSEVTVNQTNAASPLVPAGSDDWTRGGLWVVTGAGSWDYGGRLTLAGGLAMSGAGGGEVRARAREGYARLSATDWMDVEAGKRRIRWGVGYGFSPAGVLDPPRIATDPTDRLGLNEGRPMACVDLFRHQSSVTLAVSSDRLVAARVRTVTAGGLEIALVASAAPGAGPSWGGTLTHVVGQRLEWHAEVIEQDATHGRAISAVAGLQYTFQPGVNVVLEYHRNGRGLDGRHESLFVRAARSGGETTLAPEVILIAGLNDGSRTLIPGVTWTPASHLQVYARGTRLFGGRRAIARVAPWSTAFTLGATLRF
jgi:hypothetical protein